MNRREFNRLGLRGLVGASMLHALYAHALSLADISNPDATNGLKTALQRGVQSAIGALGRTDGFLGNDRVRIPLPSGLESASNVLRMLGQGGRLDELVTTMNRAAETAVPMASGLMVDAVKNMSVSDAKKILSGGPTSGTDFFSEKTRAPLGQKFLPIVTQTTHKVGLTDQYNQLAGRAAEAGLMSRENANIDQFVTTRALNGLYLLIGDEEKKIRNDPVGTGSALLSKVFGALR